MTPQSQQLLRQLPSVTSLLAEAEVQEWLHETPRAVVVEAIQSALDRAREAIRAGKTLEPIDIDAIIGLAEEELITRSRHSLRRVINATGIVLHTGLGRAPLAEAALDAIVDGASGYCNLEFDLESGCRGSRREHLESELIGLTGAEAATVVNNNAAATLLILRALAAGREVIVSRGQLVEIGGSYRLPEIMRASGAILREVGTTNRTRIADYEHAISERTGALLRVHTSNYRIVGFCESAGLEDLVALGRERGIPVIDDLGSGALIDLAQFGLPGEPVVGDSLRAGADLVCFSGDKLLGGPQAGIILGRRSLVDAIEADPLARAFRVDKLTLLALSATLRAYHDPEETRRAIPALRLLATTTDELAESARALAQQLEKAAPGERFYVCSDVGFAGGGSLPQNELPTVVVQWRPTSLSADAAAVALRRTDPPVVARIRDAAICFDLRTISTDDFAPIADAVAEAVWHDGPDSGGDDAKVRLPVL